MAISAFDLFKIGIGPSSSHTVGPMRAARFFAQHLLNQQLLQHTSRIQCLLYGSLGATGKGHGSDKAVILGLCGHEPETVDVEHIDSLLHQVRTQKHICLLNEHTVPWHEKEDLQFLRTQTLPFHANGMKLRAWNSAQELISEKTYYSVGGGFVVTEEVIGNGDRAKQLAPDTTVLPIPFRSATELLDKCRSHQISIALVMRTNERYWRSEQEIEHGLLKIWQTMQDCVNAGLRNDGCLPGNLQVKRRAPKLWRDLSSHPEKALTDPLAVLDWVNLYALAVNEENAAGGRVVTAPTNGAAGIIPAVLHYYRRFVPNANDSGVINFLLTAAAIGILYKENASISGAEVGCQGEVGVACSMAAGALCAVLGGTPEQVENAAEIGMEHHLGLTCDPVGGLVQIPCIERNAIASVKAINAARMALRGDGSHFVSLDQVIKTMRETGADMKTKYKETSRGGLAVNIIEC